MPTAAEASDAARYVFITAFSVLSAFLLRDIVQQTWKEFVLKKRPVFWKLVVFQVLFLILVFGVTFLVAAFWPNNDTNIVS